MDDEQSVPTKSFKIPIGRRLSIGEVTGLIVLVLNIAAIIWAAATATSTLNTLATGFTEIRNDVRSQSVDINTIKLDVGILKADVSNLKQAPSSNGRGR